MLKDLQAALRSLRKAPAFTAVALITLALAIGANTAIFTLIDATVLRPLPVRDPGQLTLLTDPADSGTSHGTSGGRRGLLAYSEYMRLRHDNNVFRGLLAAESGTSRGHLTWGSAGAGAEQTEFKLVSNNYFSVLGVAAYRGRTFAPGPVPNLGSDPVAVISYAFWNQRFARNPAIIGSTFRLHGHVYTVIGVTPPGFFGENVGEAPRLWLPLTMQLQALPGQDQLHDPPGVSRVMWLQVIGRRKPGVTLAEAQAASNAIFQHSVEQQAGAAVDAQSRRDILSQHLALSSAATGASGVRGEFADPLWALLALVGLVLLVAIVNLASLELARATARQREMSLRLALGAGRARIVRQLLTESVLLSVVGGLLGVLLAFWGDHLLLGLVGAGAGNGMALNLAPDWRVLGFIALLSVGSGVVFGLIPALRLSHMKLAATLQAQGRSVHGRLRLGKALVIGQVALSILLLAGAGLFVRNLAKMQAVPLGFTAGNLAEFSVGPGLAGYKDAAAVAFFHRFLDRLQATPGISAAALADDGLFAHSEGGLPVAIEGYTPASGQRGEGSRFDQVSAGYFHAVGIPIILGRGLTAPDATSGVKNAVINQTLEKRFFAGRNPLGQQLRDLYPDDHGAVYTIVGVCADAKYNNLAEKTPPRFYLSFFNGAPGSDYTGAHVFVRGRGGAGSVTASVRRLLRSLDPNVPMSTPQNLTAMVGASLATQKMLARLSGFFGIVALLLAAIGLYGIMAYAVARRTAEIGIRMALGASRATVTGMVLAETLLLAAVGIAIGIPASVGGGKLLASQIHLFDLRFYDPVSLGIAVGLLTATACLAGYLPALRASRIDPLTALRQE
ncbi:MAG: ABC transporter permease [Terriglobales bacterium]